MPAFGDKYTLVFNVKTMDQVIKPHEKVILLGY